MAPFVQNGWPAGRAAGRFAEWTACCYRSSPEPPTFRARQVSNWFVNHRGRVWQPLVVRLAQEIEEEEQAAAARGLPSPYPKQQPSPPVQPRERQPPTQGATRAWQPDQYPAMLAGQQSSCRHQTAPGGAAAAWPALANSPPQPSRWGQCAPEAPTSAARRLPAGDITAWRTGPAHDDSTAAADLAARRQTKRRRTASRHGFAGQPQPPQQPGNVHQAAAALVPAAWQPQPPSASPDGGRAHQAAGLQWLLPSMQQGSTTPARVFGWRPSSTAQAPPSWRPQVVSATAATQPWQEYQPLAALLQRASLCRLQSAAGLDPLRVSGAATAASGRTQQRQRTSPLQSRLQAERAQRQSNVMQELQVALVSECAPCA